MLKEERRKRRKSKTNPLPLQNTGAATTTTPAPLPVPVAVLEQAHVNYVNSICNDLSSPTNSVNDLSPTSASTAQPPLAHAAPLRPSTVQGITYFPQWLTQTEAATLHAAIYSCRQDKWVTLPTTQRRLQEWGGRPGATSKEAGPFPLPHYQQHLATRLVNEELFDSTTHPNHVLINAYAPGQGILPHQDGPAYHPKVCIISLEQTVILSFRRKLGVAPAASIVLKPNSLVVFEGDAYDNCLHSIESCLVETTLHKNVVNGVGGVEGGDEGGSKVHTIERTKERISMTIRYVPPVSKSEQKTSREKR